MVSSIVSILVLLIGLAAVQSARPSALAGSIASGLVLLAVSWLVPPVWWLFALYWLLYAGIVFVVLAHDFRRRWVTVPLFDQIKRLMPPMSNTEQQAMAAGTVWWDGELFSGKPRWNKLLDLPAPRLNEQERAFLDGPVETLCAMLDDWQIGGSPAGLPERVWRFLGEQGFFGLIIPEQYGGKGFSAFAHSEIVLKLSSRSIAAGVTVMVPNSLGPAELLLHYGTPTQKSHYLPRLASGEEIPCFALTGPEAGSDASATPDLGLVCLGEHAGAQVLGVRLNFNKRYITLAPVATVIGLAFQLEDPDGLLGAACEPGITVALIPAHMPGVTIGQRHNPLDVPFLNGPIQGKDVFVPLDWIIGGQARIGQGWPMLVESLSAGRGISLPALSTASGKIVCRYTGAYARIREQFGLPIGRFEGVAEVLARIAGRTYQMDAARRLTLVGLDAGEKPGVLTAILKYHATERMRQVVNDGMDIQGGSGIMLGPRNILGRVYQALPIGITVEGANILTRSLIIFGQGAARAHPYARQEMELAANPDPDLAETVFDDLITSHTAHFVSNLARAALLGLTWARFGRVPSVEHRRQLRLLSWLAAAFAVTSDTAMVLLGGELKRREAISARLGDALSQLYLASAVLFHFASQGSPRDDRDLATWALQDSLAQCQRALIGALENFPRRWIGRLVKRLVFPYGSLQPPSDRLSVKVAQLLLEDGPARDRLTDGIYRVTNPKEPTARLDSALALLGKVAPHEAKIREAERNGTLADERGKLERIDAALIARIVTETEAAQLREYEALRAEIIQVDAVDPARLPAESAANAEAVG